MLNSNVRNMRKTPNNAVARFPARRGSSRNDSTLNKRPPSTARRLPSRSTNPAAAPSPISSAALMTSEAMPRAATVSPNCASSQAP